MRTSWRLTRRFGGWLASAAIEQLTALWARLRSAIRSRGGAAEALSEAAATASPTRLGASLSSRLIEMGVLRELQVNEDDLRALLYPQQPQSADQPAGTLAAWVAPVVRVAGATPVRGRIELRWDHLELGTLSYARFAPIAERAGLGARLNALLFEHAWELSMPGRASEATGLPITVPLSEAQFHAPGLARAVAAALDGGPEQDSGLEIAISERVLLRDIEAAAHVVRALRALGVDTTVDDYAASSADQLHAWGVNAVSIDFFGATRTEGQRAYVAEAVRSAKAAGVTVTAVRVGTPAESQFCSELECDFATGEAYGEPRLRGAGGAERSRAA